MWQRAKSVMNPGVSTRRRGTRLGIAIAIMAIIPGLVAGTSFISGAASSTLTGTPTATPTGQCGFSETTGTQDTNYITTVAGTGEYGSSTIYSSVTFGLAALEVGSSGHAYFDGEFNFACVSTPATGSSSAAISISGSGTTGATYATVSFEQVTETATAPSFLYCAPAADEPAADSASTGTCPGTGTAQPVCAGTLYLPNDGDTTAANWATWNTVGGAAVAGCGSLTSISLAAGISTTEYYGVVSFAIVGGLTAVSGSWTVTASVTAT